MKLSTLQLPFLLILACVKSFAQPVKSTVNIDALISKMSIEEKVGQMTQIDLGVIAKGDICNLENPQRLDNEKLKLAIEKYHIGSILNVGCGSGTIAMGNWQFIINKIHSYNTNYSSNKVPIIYGIDAIHGVNYTMGGTLFPQQTGQAATWNPILINMMYGVTAYECRASGIPWNFSPVLDLGRQPLWSRFFESFGEDVYLAKTMTREAVNGLQGENVQNQYRVAACMKHFLGYSMPLSGKDRTPAWISDRELREYFLPTFQEAIKANAQTVMINSGEINGTPTHINYEILTTLLRDELGFKGVAVTDWEDIYKLVNVHRVAKDKREAVKLAIMAGVDMSMTPNDFEFNDLLIALVKDGEIPESRLDLSVRRILQLKKDLGLFENVNFSIDNYPDFGSVKHANISYRVTAESITLLKNQNNTLPISNEKLLVCGPAANSLNLLNGAWTHTWLGRDTTYNTKGKATILQALVQNYGNANISFAEGATLNSPTNLADCIEKAKKADKIIICLGEEPGTEIPGNIDNLGLPQAQEQLVQEMAKLGKPIVLVLCFNRPRIIHSIVPLAQSIVMAYLPGDEGGKVIADCINGKVNPSGKLPFTYPAHVNAFVHYDHKGSEDLDVDFSTNAYRPEFDFGFGLSYTSFTYSNYSVSVDTLARGKTMSISVDITNTGKVLGSEVAQLYYTDLVASITPSVKKLCAYEKISLKPGETKTVKFEITAQDFSFINKQLQRVTEPGDVVLQISNNKKTIYVQ